MKKIIHLVFYIAITNVIWSQDLHVATGGEITTMPGTVLYVGNNVSVDGNITTKSDATKSGSFIVAGNVTGDVTYKRYVNDTDWHLYSAPVTSQGIPAFVADGANKINVNGTTYAVAYYNNSNPSTKRWKYHNASPTLVNQEALVSFTSGLGYTMNRTEVGDYTFTGTMANTNVTMTIPFNNSGSHFWSSIGNPYPSFLPANNSANAASNVLKDNISKLDPSFAFLYVWNGAAYVPIGIDADALQLAPGQAFFVNAKSGSETFTFSKASQNHNSGTATFYKNANITPTVVVSLTNGSNNKETTLKFVDTCTKGLDVGYDAGAYQDGTPSFSLDTHLVSDSKGIDFTIQCLPTKLLSEDVAIPLSIRAAVNEKLSFSIATTNLPEGINVYLEDALNNTFTLLTNAAHQVTVTKALNGIGQYYLHTSKGVLSTGDNLVENDVVNLYKLNNNSIRVTGLAANENASLKIFSITGQQIVSTKFISARINDVALPINLAAGIYVVNVLSESKEYSKKVILE